MYINRNVHILFIIKNKGLIAFLNIPLIYEQPFYKYFVRWSVGQAIKERNVRYN